MRQIQVKLGLMALAATLAGGVQSPAAGDSHLVSSGKTASTDVRVINGKAYVPLSDVAKLLNMVVIKTSGGYEIKKAGGAMPAVNLNGKVGDVLSDGKWHFQVLEVKNVGDYTIKSPQVDPMPIGYDLRRFDSTTRIVRAAPNYQLVLFRCRVTNGQKTTKALFTAPVPGGGNNALSDKQGGLHIPVAYDYPGAPIETKAMLPGEVLTFSLLFSIPQGTEKKNLVFTLRSNGWEPKPGVARISLEAHAAVPTAAAPPIPSGGKPSGTKTKTKISDLY